MAEIRMNHPGKNALGTELIAWLEGELDRAGGEPLLLTGTGDAFCAGLDLKEVAASDAVELERMLARLDRVCRRLFEHPAPTVALVNGHAIAGGCILALCCDYRVALDAPGLRIGLNEVALGACFPPGILRIVRRRVPLSAQHEVILGAGLFAPAEALPMGLVDAVRADAPEAARAWLERAARHPRRTYAHTKAVLTSGVAESTPADLARFRSVELPIWTSDDLRERVRAVLAR